MPDRPTITDKSQDSANPAYRASEPTFDAPALLAEGGQKKAGILTLDSTTVTGRNFRDNKDSVVHVKTLDKVNLDGSTNNTDGTGFFVNKGGLLVTDYHVIQHAKGGITVTTSDGKRLKATVVDVEPSTDLALLQVEPDRAAEFKPAKLAKSSAHVITDGGELTALGFPNKTTVLHASPGTFSRVRPLGAYEPDGGFLPGEDKLRPILTADMAIHRGNSGGPLLDKFGNVVGIIDLSAGKSIVSISTPVEELHRFLNRHLAMPGSESQKPGIGKLSELKTLPGSFTDALLDVPALPANKRFPPIQPADAATKPPQFFSELNGRVKPQFNFRPDPAAAPKKPGLLDKLSESKTMPFPLLDR